MSLSTPLLIIRYDIVRCLQNILTWREFSMADDDVESYHFQIDSVSLDLVIIDRAFA